MREQVVRQQHRLSVLQVRAARHDSIGMRVGLRRDRLDERTNLARDHLAVIAQIQPDKRGNLIVAAASCAQPAAELGTYRLDKGRLESTVHIFIVGTRLQGAVCPLRPDAHEALEHPCQLVVGEVARGGEGASVGARAPDVVAAQLPIKVRRTAESLQFGRRSVAEAPAPERALIRRAAHRATADCSSNQTSNAFCACRRFSASCQMTD